MRKERGVPAKRRGDWWKPAEGRQNEPWLRSASSWLLRHDEDAASARHSVVATIPRLWPFFDLAKRQVCAWNPEAEASQGRRGQRRESDGRRNGKNTDGVVVGDKIRCRREESGNSESGISRRRWNKR